jgi:hypothetical protein
VHELLHTLKLGFKITWIPGCVVIIDIGAVSAARDATHLGNHVAVVLNLGLGLIFIRKENGIRLGTSSCMSSEACGGVSVIYTF